MSEWEVLDASTQPGAVVRVRHDGRSALVRDRAVVVCGADQPAGLAPRAWTAARERLAGRGGPFEQTLTVGSGAWGEVQGASAVAAPAALAFGAAALVGAGDGDALPADAVYLGVGCGAGLVVRSGVVVVDRHGLPLDPWAWLRRRGRSVLPLAGAASAGPEGTPLDADATLALLADRRAAGVGVGAEGDLRPLTAACARAMAALGPGASLHEASAVATLRAVLATQLMAVLALWDVAVIELLLTEAKLASLLGLGDSPAGRFTFDAAGDAPCPLAPALRERGFAALRAGATVRWRLLPPDAGALGATLLGAERRPPSTCAPDGPRHEGA